MKGHIGSLMVAIIAIVLLSNCASDRMNLLKDNTVRIDKVSLGRTYIGNVYACQDGDTLQISGKFIQRGADYVKFPKGHADIAILGQDGKIIKQTSVVTFPEYRKKKRGRGLKKAKFSARIKAVPPSGSVIRVAFHEDIPKFVNTFNCGENIALQKHESK